MILPEKVIRRIMAEEGCRAVYLKKARRCSSYAGEISDAPEGLVKRGSRADAPDALWLAGVAEFGLACGKRYLSPILDCFDGRLASWSIGLRCGGIRQRGPLAACEEKFVGDRPFLHSDRGARYRRPGWVVVCDRNGVVGSMSKKGYSPDNAAMSFDDRIYESAAGS